MTEREYKIFKEQLERLVNTGFFITESEFLLKKISEERFEIDNVSGLKTFLVAGKEEHIETKVYREVNLFGVKCVVHKIAGLWALTHYASGQRLHYGGGDIQEIIQDFADKIGKEVPVEKFKKTCLSAKVINPEGTNEVALFLTGLALFLTGSKRNFMKYTGSKNQSAEVGIGCTKKLP
jgi:hypothetical protein